MLHCITAVDYFEPDEKKAAQAEWKPHLELIYHLSSLTHRHRLVLKVTLPRWLEGKPGRLPEVDSVSQRLEHGRLARARGVRPDGRPFLSGTRISAASFVPRTGWDIPCEKTTRCQPNITGFRRDRPMPTERANPETIEFDVRTDEMLINMGPQHPSTHGVLRMALRTDGEMVSEATPHIGYLHRCAEKIGEHLSPRQFLPYTDRLDYLAGDEHEPRLGAMRRKAARPESFGKDARTCASSSSS